MALALKSMLIVLALEKSYADKLESENAALKKNLAEQEKAYDHMFNDRMSVNSELIAKVMSSRSKLDLAVEALKTAHTYACDCCDSSEGVKEHCEKAIKEMSVTDVE